MAREQLRLGSVAPPEAGRGVAASRIVSGSQVAQAALDFCNYATPCSTNLSSCRHLEFLFFAPLGPTVTWKRHTPSNWLEPQQNVCT